MGVHPSDSAVQKAWVEVQWYYSRSDIGDKNMRKYVGNNELVLSDHNDIIEPEAIMSWKLMESIAPADITSFSAERAPSMLALSVKNHITQTKLNNETRKGKHQTPGHHKGSPKWDRSLTAGYSERKELEEARVMIRRLNTALVVSDAVVELNKEQWWDHAPHHSTCPLYMDYDTENTCRHNRQNASVDKSSKLDPSDLDGHNYIGKCGWDMLNNKEHGLATYRKGQVVILRFLIYHQRKHLSGCYIVDSLSDTGKVG
ncbi:hypothetical protein F5J12DRAFT_786594 [Pisolithus orientalis]|uniref:uncharacterized protein n=1 Tax=Pisolithus orientalis TaxID=936130 RepID=UPI0022246CAE|nr:uncharacterized protein F5J12DRAFT_786594 [Pisolithus orientalis]KAI5989785.1 hypothetical protein F5J12DRAFT_786594 [Pisolithus orientalis]